MSALAVMAISVTPAGATDAPVLAALAAATFPLACPQSTPSADVAAFVAANLSAQRFGEYLNASDRVVFCAEDGDQIVGYTMLVHGIGDDADVARAVQQRPAVELSKMYVLPSHHHGEAAAALMRAGIDWAARGDAAAIWLGVNCNNVRAQRFYRKHGFEVTGSRTFRLGNRTEADFVMVRPL